MFLRQGLSIIRQVSTHNVQFLNTLAAFRFLRSWSSAILWRNFVITIWTGQAWMDQERKQIIWENQINLRSGAVHCKLNSLRRGIQTHLLQSVNDTKEYYISFQYNTFYIYVLTIMIQMRKKTLQVNRMKTGRLYTMWSICWISAKKGHSYIWCMASTSASSVSGSTEVRLRPAARSGLWVWQRSTAHTQMFSTGVPGMEFCWVSRVCALEFSLKIIFSRLFVIWIEGKYF